MDTNTDEQNKSDRKTKFFVLVVCDEGTIERTVKELNKIKHVKEVRLLDDVYDILIILESNSEDELKNILSNRIRMIGTIRSTMTLQSCRELKIGS